MITLFDTSISNIKNYISEKNLLENYIGQLKPICSPFRKDKHPTITFREVGDKVFWKDWSTGERGDAFDFVAKLEYTDRDNVGTIIFDKFKNGFQKINLNKPTKKRSSSVINYAVETREFNTQDLEYWNQFNINESILKFYEVYAIKYLFIQAPETNLYYKKIDDEPYCYGYKFTNWKIYKPYSDKEEKWRFFGSSDEIEGWKQLPESGDLLIITKSLKDIMTLYSYGIASVSFQGECSIPNEEIINELKQRFKTIVILYDNDETGVKFSEIISEMYDIDQIVIPNDLGKDISDVNNNKGSEYAKALLNSLI